MAFTLGMHYSGVFWAIFIAETSVGLFTLWLFKKGSWKKAQV
jgi:Na+-driven multidrug efflux pump